MERAYLPAGGGGLQLATHSASSIAGVACLAVGLLSIVLLVRRERKRTDPVVPVDLLAVPVLGLSALGAFCAFISITALLLVLPFRFEGAMGYSPDEVGLLLLPFPLTMLFVSPVAGWLSDRIAPTKLGVTGMAIAIAALLFLATMPDQPGGFGIAWRLALCALGFGLFLSPNSRLLIGRAPRNRSAAAGGLLSTARLGGQALAAAMAGVLLAHGAGTGALPMFVACAFAVIAALCCIVRFRSVRAAGGIDAAMRGGPPEPSI